MIHETVDHVRAPGEDHPAVADDDADETCAALAERGLDIDWPPADYEWDRSAKL